MIDPRKLANWVALIVSVMSIVLFILKLTLYPAMGWITVFAPIWFSAFVFIFCMIIGNNNDDD